MKIAGARFFRYTLPLTRPLRLRDTEIVERRGVVVEIRTDAGNVGYGEIAPLPGFSKETLEEALDSARQCVRYLAMRARVEFEPPPALREREMFPPSVRFGIESALWDLSARANGAVHAAMFSQRYLRFVPLNALLLGDAETVVRGAVAAQSSGFPSLKLKVGRARTDDDVAMVRAVRDAVGDGLSIRLDANRAWDLAGAIRFASAVADCGVEYIEEPLADVAELPRFAADSPIPHAVDETLQEIGWKQLFAWREDGLLAFPKHGPPDSHYLALKSAPVWVVKPTLTGIPLRYLSLLLQRSAGIDAAFVLSSSFESGLGLRVLTSLAACSGVAAVPAGLDTGTWFAGDTIGALPVRAGHVDVEAAGASLRAFTPDSMEEL